jgi:hypothetical protein
MANLLRRIGVGLPIAGPHGWLPRRQPPLAVVTNAGGLGSIAWAHGTLSVARQCAPSLQSAVS